MNDMNGILYYDNTYTVEKNIKDFLCSIQFLQNLCYVEHFFILKV